MLRRWREVRAAAERAEQAEDEAEREIKEYMSGEAVGGDGR